MNLLLQVNFDVSKSHCDFAAPTCRGRKIAHVTASTPTRNNSRINNLLHKHVFFRFVIFAYFVFLDNWTVIGQFGTTVTISLICHRQMLLYSAFRLLNAPGFAL